MTGVDVMIGGGLMNCEASTAITATTSTAAPPRNKRLSRGVFGAVSVTGATGTVGKDSTGRVRVVMGLLLVMGLELRPEWFYAHLALSLALTFSLISWTLLPLPSYHKVGLVVLAVGIAAVTVLQINGLSVYPSIHITDEGWTLSWAVDYLKTGSLSQCPKVGQQDTIW